MEESLPQEPIPEKGSIEYYTKLYENIYAFPVKVEPQEIDEENQDGE